MLTFSEDTTAKLWDLEGNELCTYSEFTDMVSAVDFSPDGKSILTGTFDNKVELWHTPEAFLEEKVHKFTLQELYDAGTILSKEDLKKIKPK